MLNHKGNFLFVLTLRISQTFSLQESVISEALTLECALFFFHFFPSDHGNNYFFSNLLFLVRLESILESIFLLITKINHMRQHIITFFASTSGLRKLKWSDYFQINDSIDENISFLSTVLFQ